MIKKIHSIYLLKELFSFISEKKMIKLIKNNIYLIKRLDFSNDDLKSYFFKRKIEKYEWLYIKDYYDEFYKDVNSIIQDENELKEIFYNCLSKNANFDLNILDNKFDLIFNNNNFKKRIRINMENINEKDLFIKGTPKLLLIKDNKFVDKVIKIFKDSFKSFSTNELMNKEQYKKFMSSNIIMNENIDNLLSRFGFYESISFENFINFYFNLFKDKINILWEYFYSLEYNNLLEKKKEIDFNYIFNHQEEFEINLNSKLIEIAKERIYKLSLINKTNETIIPYFHHKQIFQNIKIIDISNYNLKRMIDLNIICPNLDELNINFNKENYDINELNIFPNMNFLNVCIETKFNLFNLLRNLINSKLKYLEIYINNFDNEYKIDSKIFLNNIISLKIEGKNINDFLFFFFNNIELSNLTQYIINIDLNEINNKILISNNSDYNIINQFIFEIIDNKQNFYINSFFSLLNKLKLIRYLQLNFKTFVFQYIKKRDKNYLFKFNINNPKKFKKYYSTFDLSIDENEIIKYKKIDIKGLNNKTNIEDIIEKEDIYLCDIYFNLNIKQYFIQSFKNLRSIYNENEVNLSILNKLLNQDLKNLQYINLNLGDDISNNFCDILINLLQKSENLKSLILKVHSNIYNTKINLLFEHIQNLRKLQILNISQNNRYPIYDINVKTILEQFPKLDERKYYFDEFIIGNEIFVSKKKPIIIYENTKYLFGKNFKILGNENNEIIQKSIVYLNNKRITNNNNYVVSEIEPFTLKVIFKDSLVDMSYMFYNCSSLISLNLLNFNTNNVKDMSYMFYNCSSLINLDLSYFDTNNVENMKYMFCNCSSLTNLNLSNFNNNNVIKMSYMFSNCSSLTSLNLTNFYTNNVVNMSYMFHCCYKLNNLDLSYFNTNNVIDMSYMFYNCSSLINLDLSYFDTNNVSNMSYMFYNCSSLINLNLSNFNVDKVYNMYDMFYNLNKDCNVISNSDEIIQNI